jgi:small redox-active disulfide protein 2
MANSHKIEVLGSGCPGCKKLHKMTVEAAGELGLAEEVGYATDINRIIEMGVMQTPVLAVDGKPVLAGFIPDPEQVKEALQKALK